jgi:uncharacterized damage-inducible protein DinB
MDPRTVQELCRHNTWANRTILEVATALTPGQFRRDLGGSFPSVQATLTHIMWAEWFWLERWIGRSPTDVFTPETFASTGVLGGRWARIQADQARFVDSLTDETLHAPVSYVNRKGETWAYALWRQIYHVLSHSSYHRGQVIHKLRQLGFAAPTTDFLNFCDAPGADREP